MVKERENRIDLLRGLALLLIFIGHADFSFSEVFRNARGFSDASEIFVLLAGVSAALAYYSPASATGGWNWRKPFKRAMRLYIVHLGLFAVVVAIAAVAAFYPGHASGIVLHALELSAFWTMPDINAARAVWLAYMPGNLDILPLYIFLLLLTPLVFRLHDRFVPVLIALSVAVWAVAGIDHINLPNTALPGLRWYFNPFSWQLIFITGIVIGIRIKTGQVALPYNRIVFTIAAVFALTAIPANLLAHFEWIDLPFPELYQELISKTNAGPLRLVNTLAIVYLAWNIPAVKRASVHPFLRPLCIAGKHSLPVFVTGIFLSNGVLVLMLLRPQTPVALQLALLVAGCGLQLALGQVLEQRKRRMAETGTNASLTVAR